MKQTSNNYTQMKQTSENYTAQNIKRNTWWFSIGNNVNPCPIDKLCISLDYKADTQFLLLFMLR